jgi:hypothetical protein
MIDDLFVELAIGSVNRLLAPETPREDADFGLARLNASLSPLSRMEGKELEPEMLAAFGPELESRILSSYFELSADDLEQISPRVHEWVLDRASQSASGTTTNIGETLRKLYFLFPESTIRHSVVGLFIQIDHQQQGQDLSRRNSPISVILEGINEDKAISPEDRNDQIRILSDFVLDYMDLFPGEVDRALALFRESDSQGTLKQHLLLWSDQLGGERRFRIRRAVGEF